jgi:hypothetical protein
MPLAGTASRAVFGAAVWLPCPSRGSGRSRLEKVPGLRRDRPPGVFVRWREPPLTYENVRNGVPEALGGAAGDRHNRRK